MKKFSIFKIVQLSILAVLTLISTYFLFQPEIKQFVFSQKPATVLFFLIWGLLLASFVFLLFDFNLISSIKLSYHNLYGVAYSDPLSGIPNRFSCDTLIEKYIDKTLPDDIACIMLDLPNLPKINSLYDHTTGNKVLKDFSSILSASALSVCFVGRNGGNKFLAVFENCTEDKLNIFLSRVEDRVKHHNQLESSITIEYRTGLALNSTEHLSQITRLISLANQRLEE